MQRTVDQWTKTNKQNIKYSIMQTAFNGIKTFLDNTLNVRLNKLMINMT